MARKFNWDAIGMEGYQAYMAGDNVTAQRIFTAAFKQTEKFGRNDVRLGYTCMMIGSCSFRQAQFQQAQPYFRRAARIYKHHDRKIVLDSLWWLALCYYMRRHYQRAARIFVQYAQLAEDVEDAHRDGEPLTHAAECCWRTGRYSDAIELFGRALQKATPAIVSASAAVLAADQLLNLIAGATGEQLGQTPELLKLALRACQLARRKRARLEPAETKTVPHSDSYFGKLVKDPYRWLEETHSPPVANWLHEQSVHANRYIKSLPGRNVLWQRIHDLYRAEPPHLYRKLGQYYFFDHHPFDKAAQQLFRTSKRGRFAKLVLDANALPENALLAGSWISPDGELLAYGVAKNGSDWHSIKIKNLSTGKHYKEVIKDLRNSSVAWKADKSGFYYCAFTRSHRKQRVNFHKLGTPQSRDTLVYEHRDADVLIGISTVFDGAYLLISTTRGETHRYSIALKPLAGRNRQLITLFAEHSCQFHFIGEFAGILYFITDKNAPKRRIVSVTLDASKRKPTRLRNVVEEKTHPLKRAYLWGETLFCLYLTEQGQSIECISRLDGRLLSQTRLPANAAVKECGFIEYPKMTMRVEGHTTPNSIYEFDFKTGQLHLDVSQTPLVDMTQYTTELLYARSKDGTLVPFYVSYKKGLPLDGDNPTILTGYGGFNVCVEPRFCHYKMAWMELGGVCVEAVLRGGGEFGRQWRDDGAGEKKQNTFNDFIAVAQALIRKRFSRPARLGIVGASNGGLLAAAVLTQRPKLFGAAVVGDGLLDMLRYQKFDFARHYIGEYGCADKKKGFETLYAYSPLHRLRRRQYPPVLISASAADDRVNPAHSYKFAATLQAMQTGNGPILLSIEKNAGHSGHNKSWRALDELCFFGQTLGLLPDAYLRDAAAKARRAAATKKLARQASS